MSIVYFDGFGTYGNLPSIQQAGWGFTVSPLGQPASFAPGRFANSSALNLPTGSEGSARRVLVTENAGASEFVVGYAVRFSAVDSAVQGMLTFKTADRSVYQLVLNGNGFLAVRANSNLGTLSTNVTRVTLAEGTTNVGIVGNWNFIEFRVFDGTNFQVFVNGVLDMSGSLLDIFNIKSIVFGREAILGVTGDSNTNQRITDLYIKVAGGTYNSDTLPLGDCRVFERFPDTDVATGFVPNSGITNSENVSEVPDDGDTTFVSATNTGTIDAYRSSTVLPFNPQKIHGVSVGLVARKTDAGLRSVGVRVQSAGGTVVNFPGFPLGTGYQRIEEYLEVDPDGSIEWTKPKVDALVYGPRVEV